MSVTEEKIMGKPPSGSLFLLFIIPLFFVSFFFCEEDTRITSRCELRAPVKFHNDSTPTLTVTYTDSTNWDTSGLTLDANMFSHEEDTSLVPGNSEHTDTLMVTWEFEHHDIYYKEGSVCGALVDLNLIALISRADSVIRTIDLDLNCDSLFLDTTYVDTDANLYINKFTSSKIFIIP